MGFGIPFLAFPPCGADECPSLARGLGPPCLLTCSEPERTKGGYEFVGSVRDSRSRTSYRPRGMPELIRYDSGPELTSPFLGWCEQRKIQLIHIQPGRPMQNGHVESFNGRPRDECLNASWFRNMAARTKISSWHQEYNSERLHSSLGYRTPNELAETRDPQLYMDEKIGAGHSRLTRVHAGRRCFKKSDKRQ